MRHTLSLLTLVLSFLLPLSAQAKEVKAFFFGNSLVHHLEGLPQTSVPYWLQVLAQTDGNTLRANGVWGFLPNFADRLPPEPNWSISGVRSAWSSRAGTFGNAGIDSVVLNPANFIQYQDPTDRYEGDNPKEYTPVSATLPVVDWSLQGAPETRIFIYEGWAELAQDAKRFPPKPAELKRYWDRNAGKYHNWYNAYVGALQNARPDAQITLIPVASTLARLMARPELQTLTGTDLFSDDAPHGTATTYFLAAMIAYEPLFGQPLPDNVNLPNSIHPIVQTQYAALRGAIAQARTSAVEPPKAPTSDVAADTPSAPQDRETASSTKRPKAAPPRTQPSPQIPALAMGLEGISDWSTQYPFIDLMKSARSWIGHKPDQWGGWDDDQLEAAGHLSAEGWPLRVPEGVDRIEAFVLTDLPEEARYFAGRYRLTYEGSANLELIGRVANVDVSDGEIWFDFTPGDGLVAISLDEIDAGDPIRNIALVQEKHIPFFELGHVFNPDWLTQIEDLRVLRFMDWMYTNSSPISAWDQRPQISDYSWRRRGVPLEVMIALSNQIGADPWFNMPHRADDAFVRKFAETVARDLDPRLKAYVEYSNEVWNFIFDQAAYARDRAEERWGIRDKDAWMQWAGVRAAEVMDIWTEVFASAATDRLVRVVGTHTGWQGLEEALLEPSLFRKENRNNRAPAESFDAYAVTGYFGYELGEADNAKQVLQWLNVSESEALKRSHKALRDGAVKELNEVLFPYHGKVAKKYGYDLIMYEGGTHVVAHGEYVNDERLSAFFQKLNYSQEMAALYSDVLEGWTAAGGTLFNAFVDVSQPSQWGSWGAKRHLWDENPRWDTLMQANASMPTDWEQRDTTAFRRGIMKAGTAQADLIEGSPLTDTLVGYDGDDWFLTLGGADMLHGGAGVDTATLPGALEDYTLIWAGSFLLASGPEGELILHSIEQLEFDAEPGQVFAVSPRS